MMANLPEAPQWSDAIEASARAQVAQRGGPEATIIDWTNRGLASDNFNTTFGASAETMRNIVDAALLGWQQVITNWNRSDGSVSLQVSITVAAPGTGFGGGAGPGNAPADGKPRTGSVSLGGGNNTADPNDVNGWFADPDPFDNAEFLGNIINAYTGVNSTGGLDFYSLVSIEMAHVLGIISDPNNAGGGLQGYRLENFVTNTGIPDIAQGGGNGTYRTFTGPTIRHLMTSFNSGSGGLASWGNVVHTAGPTADITFGGTQWRGSVDPGNALYGGQRYLPSFATAHILRDAYAYTIAEPMTFGTFHAVIDETSGRLTVRGGGGMSNDNINISFVNGNTIRVSVDVGADVPGTGALPGAGNLPAFVTDFLAIGVTEIVVDAGEGNDTINIESLPFFADATVRGGLGNDFIQFAPTSADLDAIAAPINLDGGGGTDNVLLADYNSPNSHTYAVGASTLTRPGAGAWTFSNLEVRELYGADGNNTFNVAGTLAGTLTKLAGHFGNDTFNVGAVGANADLIDGNLELFGEEGTDTINYNDLTAAGLLNYTLTTTQILRTGNAAVNHDTSEAIRIDAGAGDNAIALADLLPAFDPPALVVNGNAGNDSIQVNVTEQRFNNTLPFTVDGGAGTDAVTINTSRSGTGTLGAPTLSNNSFSVPTGRTVDYTAFESLVCNVQYVENRVFFILSTAATTPVTINGGTLRDSFAVGGTPGFFGNVTLDNILGPLTLNGNGEVDTVLFNDHSTAFGHVYTLNAGAFSRTGTAPVSFGTSEAVQINGGAGADTINVADHLPGTPVTVDGRAGLDTVNVNSDGAGAATVLFAATQDLASLNLFAGGTGVLTAGLNKVIETDALTVASTGKLDLSDNAMIVDYVAGASPAATVRALLTAGRNGGTWNGASGIVSSAAAATTGRAVGYAESAAAFSAFPATFAGVAVDSTAVLLRYTFNGDANLDGNVNLGDFNRLAANFGQSGRAWSDGDSDYNGTVNLNDFNQLASNFGLSLAPDGAVLGKSLGEGARLRMRSGLPELA